MLMLVHPGAPVRHDAQPATKAPPISPRSLRAAMIEWVSDSRFTHAITLNLNRREAKLETAKKLFGRFCLAVDQMMIGKRRVQRLPSCMRFEAIAMPEHVDSNLHLHVAANFAPRYWAAKKLTPELERELHRIWRRITGSGTLLVRRAWDVGWGSYITKEWYRQDHDYFYSPDFHPNDSVVYCSSALEILTA